MLKIALIIAGLTSCCHAMDEIIQAAAIHEQQLIVQLKKETAHQLAQAILEGRIDPLHAEQAWADDLKALVKEHLLTAHLALFADIFKSIFCKPLSKYTQESKSKPLSLTQVMSMIDETKKLQEQKKGQS